VLRPDEETTHALPRGGNLAHDQPEESVPQCGDVGNLVMWGVTMANVAEVLCTGILVVHIDESARCTKPGCGTRWDGDASVAIERHLDVVACSSYFVEGCPACRDIRVWTR
jgi:hypothetical protein